MRIAAIRATLAGTISGTDPAQAGLTLALSWGSRAVGGAHHVKAVNLIAAGLLIVFIVVPAVLLGLMVAPWFFLIMVGLIFVPLIFMRPQR
jgi:hypothetical protein